MAADLLDPELNHLPDGVERIHLMGVCGTGVGALAGMLKERGYTVTGSDANVYPPMSDFLASRGITIMEGYRPENLAHRPDLVIVGNVITRHNPEAKALARARLPYLSMPQAVNRFFIGGKTSLVVCGTHGKTTTSSLLATILHAAGHDPGFMIGGIVQAFGRNYRLGGGRFFVTEGDEYDTAFFDKGPKFLHYRPDIAIITSVEFDHADIYADLEAIKASFQRLCAIMPRSGCLVANHDDPMVREVTAGAPCAVLSYGEGTERHWRLTGIEVTPEGTGFTAMKKGKEFGRFRLPMPGRHNAMNALAVLAVLERLGVDAATAGKHMRAFPGVRRRQEVRGVVDGVTVIDDFAHHPTAVAETLDALRRAHAGKRLVAVFEPRTNSSRRAVFQRDYPRVFDNADVVLVKEPAPLDSIPAEERFSAGALVDDLRRRGAKALHFPTTGAIIAYLVEHAVPDDVIVIMSNGGFDNIHQRLIEALRARREAGPC